MHQPDESRDLPMMPAPRWNMDIRYTFPDFAQGHFRSTFLSMGMEYNLRQDHFYAMDDTETATPDYGIFNISAVTGRQGISAMGRNFCIKVNIPIDIHL